jgi:hypothetical protein
VWVVWGRDGRGEKEREREKERKRERERESWGEGGRQGTPSTNMSPSHNATDSLPLTYRR